MKMDQHFFIYPVQEQSSKKPREDSVGGGKIKWLKMNEYS